MHAITLYAVEHDCGCTFGTRKSTYLQENNNGEERRNSVSNIVPIDLMTITQERTPEKIEEKKKRTRIVITMIRVFPPSARTGSFIKAE